MDYVVTDTVDYLRYVGARTRIVFHVTLFLLVWVLPCFWLRPPLVFQSLVKRTQTLAKIEASPLALPLFLVKAVLSKNYYQKPEAAREMGFDGKPLFE